MLKLKLFQCQLGCLMYISLNTHSPFLCSYKSELDTAGECLILMMEQNSKEVMGSTCIQIIAAYVLYVWLNHTHMSVLFWVVMCRTLLLRHSYIVYTQLWWSHGKVGILRFFYMYVWLSWPGGIGLRDPILWSYRDIVLCTTWFVQCMRVCQLPISDVCLRYRV